MERLTERIDGVAVSKERYSKYSPCHHCEWQSTDDCLEDGCTYGGALDQLAAYEETKLTPEEIISHEEILKAYRHVCGGKSPEEISRLHTLIEQQGRELNRRDELIRKLDEERDYWELEAKRYCAALGEQKIKLKQLECEMCKYEDTGKCEEC